MASSEFLVEQFREAEHRLWGRYDLSPTENRVTIEEPAVEIRYWEIGSGDPLLFLHGGPNVGATWVPLIAQLDLDEWRCIAIDRPGYGLSTPIDPRGMDLRPYTVEVTASLIEQLGSESVPVVGSSAGGTIALYTALVRCQLSLETG